MIRWTPGPFFGSMALFVLVKNQRHRKSPRAPAGARRIRGLRSRGRLAGAGQGGPVKPWETYGKS